MTVTGKSYLVTGGTGFIGCALVRALLRSGARVRSLDNNSRGAQRRLADVASDVELVVGDIRDSEVVRRAVSGVDCVCHLAYINGTEFFYTQPGLVLDVALRGMINVLDACRACDAGELVLASSSEVYQTPPTIPTDETAPLSIPDVLNPRYSYGGGKVACELMAINFGRTGFDRVVIFRPHNVYGPDMGLEHVIPQFALRMGELCRTTTGTIRFPVQGTGKESRSFIYIDDMIDGVLRVIDRGKHLEIYHIGTENEVTIEEPRPRGRPLFRSRPRNRSRRAGTRQHDAAVSGHQEVACAGVSATRLLDRRIGPDSGLVSCESGSLTSRRHPTPPVRARPSNPSLNRSTELTSELIERAPRICQRRRTYDVVTAIRIN